MTQDNGNFIRPGVDMNPSGDPRTNLIDTDRFQWDDSTPDDVNPEQDERQAGSRTDAAANVRYYDISGFSPEPEPQVAPEQHSSAGEHESAAFGRVFGAEQSGAARYDAATFASVRDDGVNANANAVGGALAGTDGPMAGNDAAEVTTLDGTEFDDELWATQADAPDGFQGDVYAKGGDDEIIRDRTGSYFAEGGSFENASIHGGSGFDIVNYASLVTGVSVALDPILPVSAGTAVQQSNGLAFGADYLYGIEGVFGTTHDDIIHGDDNANKLWGHDGDDVVAGHGGNDSLWGGIGNDTVNGGSGNDYIEGNDGNDHITGGSGSDTVDGGDGNDDIWGGSDADVLHGGDGNDDIWGGSGNDVIHDGDGHDDVRGNSGNDTFFVGDGNDTLVGGSGNDEFHVSGFGDNVINGGTGNDTVIFGNASVHVHLPFGTVDRGVEGTDQISQIENIITGSGADVVIGTGGDNVLNVGSGNDEVSGLGGDDEIDGEAGNDELWGHDGADTIMGGSGNDTIDGGADIDNLSGGSHSDRITGGAGDDNIATGSGADVLVWNWGDADAVPGQDYVTDFNLAEDTFHFGLNFFAEDPGAALFDRLFAWDSGGGDSFLMANTSTDGWQSIAFLEDVQAADLNQKILNGTILDVQTAFDGPGGFVPVHDDGGMLGAGFGADYMM